MYLDEHARNTPDKPAVIMGESGVSVSFRNLVERSRRLAHFLRGCGVKEGGTIAFMLDNRPEFFDLAWAAQRLGLHYTPINWHLKPQEAAYILGDCGAECFALSQTVARNVPGLVESIRDIAHLLSVGGDLPGFTPFEAVLAAASGTPLADEIEGRPMFYSSGTTGQPKGVRRLTPRQDFGSQPIPAPGLTLQTIYGFDPDTVYLSPAPLYHAAPLVFSMTVQRFGGTVVAMERFDPLEALRLIERYRITHLQMVPTHFVRLLKLSEAERGRYDLSSLKQAIHASAPCPIDVKEQMIAWWGPIVSEFYSCTEGAGFTAIDAQDWLAHKGSVGKPPAGTVRVRGESGEELPAGEPGALYFQIAPRFEYHNDPNKTRAAYDDGGFASVGDIGYLDDDGYLFLTDRKSHMIISGGVNIYPQETENVLTLHPDVADVAVIGVPDSDFGEAVKAVVVPTDPAAAGPALAESLIGYCRDRLAHYKCPRSVDFVAELPRLPTGKLLKRRLRDQYWPKAV
jgi:acyl-CoA synthetase (AMP-forming)/AMP-acid ligase II